MLLKEEVYCLKGYHQAIFLVHQKAQDKNLFFLQIQVQIQQFSVLLQLDTSIYFILSYAHGNGNEIKRKY